MSNNLLYINRLKEWAMDSILIIKAEATGSLFFMAEKGSRMFTATKC